MTQGMGTMVFDEGMAAFVSSSTNSFGTPKCKDVVLERGKCMLCKTGGESPKRFLSNGYTRKIT